MAAQNQAYRRNVAMMREQNEFNADQAQINREWNAQMDSTKYQRTVADMQAAGVNPALAMNGGVTTQAASNSAASASSTPLLDLSSVVQMAMQAKQLRIQEKMADADISLKRADVRVKNADAEIKESDAGVRDEYNRLLLEGQRLSNDLTAEQKKQVVANIDKIGEEVELLKKQAATEAERKNLVIAEIALKRAMQGKTEAEKQRIVELLPFEKALSAAQTENQKAQAAYAMMQAAYQQNLIDSGYIESMVRENNAAATEAENKAIAAEIQNRLKTGRFYQDKGIFNKAANFLMAGATGVGHIIQAISPLSGFK